MAKHNPMQTVASTLASPDPQVLRLFIREGLPECTPKPPPRLLDQVRIAIRTRHYSRRTEKAYVGWIRRYILFHGKRHPAVIGEKEVTDFLSHLATAARVSASTQNQALSALLFLYKQVLGQNLGWLNDVVRAQHRPSLPVVLSEAEVAAVIKELRGVAWLAASLIYGAGLRQLECLRLRVKDGSVTADTALRLARFFGTTEQFWLNLQTRHDLEIEKDRLGSRLRNEVQVLAKAG